MKCDKTLSNVDCLLFPMYSQCASHSRPSYQFISYMKNFFILFNIWQRFTVLLFVYKKKMKQQKIIHKFIVCFVVKVINCSTIHYKLPLAT